MMPQLLDLVQLTLTLVVLTAPLSSLTLPARNFIQTRNGTAAPVSMAQVCYDGIGCFRNDGIFIDSVNRPISWLPDKPAKVNTRFALFTRLNRKIGQWIEYNKPESVLQSNYAAWKELKVVIHGFTDSINSGWMTDFKDALLQHGDYNVLLVDWSGGNQYPYAQATANSRIAGAVTAQLIKWMVENFRTSLSSTHLLGQSLGAHACGYVGLRFKGKIGRITGMDPAGPYFEFMHPDVRLDHTDAKFVDVIHTDGGGSWDIITMKGGFGMMQASGHVDFYPNGGKKQPPCKKDQAVNDVMACNHVVVIPMTIATIENTNRDYLAVPCESYEKFKAGLCKCGITGCASMGMKANNWQAYGRHNVRMFLDTTDSYPYEVSL